MNQYSPVAYLGCILDESGVVIHFIKRLEFLYRENKLLGWSCVYCFGKYEYSATFNYTATGWFPNLTQRLKKMKTPQNDSETEI